MKRYIGLLLCILLLLQNTVIGSFTAAAYSESTSDEPAGELSDTACEYVSGRIIVKLRSTEGRSAYSAAHTAATGGTSDFGIEAEEIRIINPSLGSAAALGGAELCAVESNVQNNMLVITLKSDEDDAVRAALDKLRANPAVEYAVRDTLLGLCSASPNDEKYASTAYAALDCIKATEAWDITTGSKNVTVAVIDSGIDVAHEDLKDNLWVNPSTGQSGYSDDLHGYDFYNRRGDKQTDEAGHGTHVAGIIGARGNNGTGVCGVAWNVSLASLRVSDDAGKIALSDAVEAINYAENHNIDIINASWGTYAAFNNYEDFVPLYEAIKNYSGLFIAAAGNDGICNDTYPFYPASFDLPNIISVAASHSVGVLSDLTNTVRVGYSNYGLTAVDIAAPGDNILSTVPENGYAVQSGTSMAAPFVAGVAALVKAKYPDLSPEEIKSRILNGAVKNSDFLVDSISNGAALNAYGALIEEKPAAVSLKIGPVGDSFTVEAGQSMLLYARVTPGEAEQKVIWSSSADEIVKITADGCYTAVSPGRAVITATAAENPELRQSVTVTVTTAESTAVEFRDKNFKAAFLYDTNKITANRQSGIRHINSLVYSQETEAVTSLDLNGVNIASLEDLHLFPKLESLNIRGNALPEEVDLTFLKELKKLSTSATVNGVLRSYYYESGAYSYALKSVKALIGGRLTEASLSGYGFLEVDWYTDGNNLKGAVEAFYLQTHKPVYAELNGEALYPAKNFISYFAFESSEPVNIHIEVQNGILITEPTVFCGIAEKLRELYPAAYGYYGWNEGYEFTEEEIREFYLYEPLCKFDLQRIGIENVFISSVHYGIANKRIFKIPVGTTAGELINGLNESMGVKLYAGDKEKNSTDKVGTGMTVRLAGSGITLDTLTAIVTGDVNGDGAITVTDMLAIKASVLKKSDLSGVYELAADTNGDGMVTVTDFIQVKAAILGKGKITAR